MSTDSSPAPAPTEPFAAPVWPAPPPLRADAPDAPAAKWDGVDRAFTYPVEGISAQKTTVIGLVSANDVFRRREMFEFESFVRDWPHLAKLNVCATLMQLVSERYGLDMDELRPLYENVFQVFMKRSLLLGPEEEFARYRQKNEALLDARYRQLYGAQGEHIRMNAFVLLGQFDDQDAAKAYLRRLPEQQVRMCRWLIQGPEHLGKFWPLDPKNTKYDARETAYANEKLQLLLAQKARNTELGDAAFQRNKQERVAEQLAANAQLAAATGQRVTQTLDPETGALRSGRAAAFAAAEAYEDTQQAAAAQVPLTAASATAAAAGFSHARAQLGLGGVPRADGGAFAEPVFF